MGLAKDIVKDVATGVMVGLIIGDEETVFPIDMVAIPAYQAYMLNGTPSMQIYIKAGETLVPTGGNVKDMTENMDVSAVSEAPKPKKRKLTAWNRYVKNKVNQIRFKSGTKKGKLDLKKMAKRYRAITQKPTKGKSRGTAGYLKGRKK